MTGWARISTGLVAASLAAGTIGALEDGRGPGITRQAQAYDLYSLAVRSLLDRDYSQAVALMEAAVERDPAPGLLLETAELHLLLHNRERASDLARQALDISADDAGAHKLLGDISLSLAQEGIDSENQVAIAIREYLAALDLDPQNHEICRLLAEIYYQTGRLDAASNLLESFALHAALDQRQALILGKIFIHTQRHDEAIPILEDVVARTPTSFEAADTLAALYEYREQFDEAIAVYQPMLIDGSPNAYVSERVGSLQVRVGRYRDAIAILEQARRLEPDSSRGLLALAQAYEKVGDSPEALRVYGERIRREPQDNEARFHFARLQSREGNSEQALEGFQEIVSSAGRNGDGSLTERDATIVALAYSQIGLLMLGTSEYDAATEAFGRALEISPEPPPEMFLLLGRAELRRGAPRATERVVAQALRRYPDNLELRVLEGEALIARGEQPRARRFFQALLDEHDHPADGYLSVAEALLRQNWYDEAEAFLDESTQLHPTDDRIHFARGAALERLGRIGEAEAALVRAIELNPRNASALNYLGYMLADRGIRLQDSVSYIERALAIDPKNPAYLDSLGWVLYKMARYDGAEESLRAAARYDQFDPTIREHLGDLLNATGRPEEAVVEWETALGRGPEQPARLRNKVEKVRAALDGAR